MYCLIQQQLSNRHRAPLYYRYGWSDASPIHGRHWYITKHVRVPCSEAWNCLQAAHALSADRPHLEHRIAAERDRAERVNAFLCDMEDDDGEPSAPITVMPALSPEERRAHCKRLQAGLVLHVHVPCSLGIGCEDLPSKSAALAHQFAVECRSKLALEHAMSSIVSWCTDMGTELGHASFSTPAQEVLPQWWSWCDDSNLVPDVDEASTDAEHTAAIADPRMDTLHVPPAAEQSRVVMDCELPDDEGGEAPGDQVGDQADAVLTRSDSAGANPAEDGECIDDDTSDEEGKSPDGLCRMHGRFLALCTSATTCRMV